MASLNLVSHHLCPYVQRAAIALAEKGVAHERTTIDLAHRPDWFAVASPLGRVPLLMVDGTAVFESAVICEHLEETAPGPRLHPADPLERARHRAWVELGSAVLADIAGLYVAPDASAFEAKRATLAGKFDRVERALAEGGPHFGGTAFSLVDAAFGPVFRYFDALDRVLEHRILAEKPRVAAWRRALAERPSVRDAVVPDYPLRLAAFLRARGGHLASPMVGGTDGEQESAADGLPASSGIRRESADRQTLRLLHHCSICYDAQHTRRSALHERQH